jgi:hypothetical protein
MGAGTALGEWEPQRPCGLITRLQLDQSAGGSVVAQAHRLPECVGRSLEQDHPGLFLCMKPSVELVRA